jgi:hypothetical protein
LNTGGHWGGTTGINIENSTHFRFRNRSTYRVHVIGAHNSDAYDSNSEVRRVFPSGLITLELHLERFTHQMSFNIMRSNQSLLHDFHALERLS